MFASGNNGNVKTEIIQISVTDDDVYEESEQITVNISSVEPSSAAVIGEPHSNTYTVLDNDGSCTKWSQIIH